MYTEPLWQGSLQMRPRNNFPLNEITISSARQGESRYEKYGNSHFPYLTVMEKLGVQFRAHTLAFAWTRCSLVLLHFLMFFSYVCHVKSFLEESTV